MDLRPRLALCVALAALTGCTGVVDWALADGAQSLPADAQPAVSGARRLTRFEYDATLEALLADVSRSGFSVLPEDATDPFDNDYTGQLASAVLVEGAEKLAADAALRLLASPAKLEVLLPCTPTGPGDADCLRRFIVKLGRSALRRPLSEEEISRYLSLQALAVEDGKFETGVELVVRALLQEPEFLYRVERGEPVDGRAGVFRLSQFELATRMSYFLWGSTPPSWLLDSAERGELASAEQRTAAAVRLMEDPRAHARVERFHALWLGFHQLPHPVELTRALRQESAALLERVIFSEATDYFRLFDAPDTFVDPLLAEHYGLPAPATPAGGWVPYGATGRRGLLSHGSVLSAGAKFDDTSPTQRGIFVRNRLLCQEVAPPPPSVNADEKPTSPTSNCKVDRYSAHATQGSCAGCHQALDPIGFGLERYDRAGKERSHDLNEPSCLISGAGAVAGVGDFNGPAELGALLVASGQLESCVSTQVFRFAFGRRESVEDAPAILARAAAFRDGGRSFQQLWVELVSDPTFAFRREE